MDSSFREQGSDTQEAPRNYLVSLTILAGLINWLAGLINWTEEDQEAAGIYLERPGGDKYR